MSLPGAAELFRSTTPGRPTPPQQPAPRDRADGGDRADAAPAEGSEGTEEIREAEPRAGRRLGEAPAPGQRPLRAVPPHGSMPAPPEGEEPRVERVNVRIPSDLLLELERARTSLAREHGLPVSRAELVAAALGIALDDYDAWGVDSALVRRLGDD